MVAQKAEGKPNDLDSNAPANHRTALLLIDVINHFDFPGGDKLLEAALRIAPFIGELKARARAAKVPIVYVNDNFGQWRSSFEKLVAQCIAPGQPSSLFVQQLVPEPEDYVVLKPKHSAFYLTPLEILLKHFGTERLILTGLCTDSCILFTAQDAYMRDMRLVVPADCVASQCMADHQAALKQMETITKADISESSQIQF
jgi:nicotinamidase-related amidase